MSGSQTAFYPGTSLLGCGDHPQGRPSVLCLLGGKAENLASSVNIPREGTILEWTMLNGEQMCTGPPGLNTVK